MNTKLNFLLICLMTLSMFTACEKEELTSFDEQINTELNQQATDDEAGKRIVTNMQIAPFISCSINGPGSLPEGSSATYSAPNYSGVSYEWIASGSLNIVSGQNARVVTVESTGAGSGTLHLIITHSLCVRSCSKTINCPPAPCTIEIEEKLDPCYHPTESHLITRGRYSSNLNDECNRTVDYYEWSVNYGSLSPHSVVQYLQTSVNCVDFIPNGMGGPNYFTIYVTVTFTDGSTASDSMSVYVEECDL